MPPVHRARAARGVRCLRSVRWVFALALAAKGVSAQGAPPDSARGEAAVDSLRARLERAEAAIELLRAQLATESASAVRTRSRLQLDLSARLMLNLGSSRGTLAGTEIPVFATPDRVRDPVLGSAGASAFVMSLRQSLVGASLSVDSVAGATLAADIEFDFFARALDVTPPLFPEPRLRTARAFLVWPRTELLVGTETPLISDLNPISGAGVAVPVFSTAGNLWNWLPQVRLTRTLWTHEARHPLSLAVQGAMLSPYAVDRHVANLTGPDAGTLSGRPAFESRVRLRVGADLDAVPAQGVLPRGAEIGVGTHSGRLRVVGDSTQHSWAVATDLRIALGAGVEVRGEAYRGGLLRGLGGGAIGQNFGTLAAASEPGVPLTDTAGWLQLNAQLRPRLVSGVGCGTDRVHGAAADRRRNSVCAAHAMWRPRQPLLLAVEYRDLRTRYAAGVRRGSHLNIGLGIEL